MEEEEEVVLGYLDRVLEEDEEVFECGDGELDPITLLHRQFKVRQLLGRRWQGNTRITPTHLLYVTRLNIAEWGSLVSVLASTVHCDMWLLASVLQVCDSH